MGESMRTLKRSIVGVIALVVSTGYGVAAHADVFVTIVGSRQGTLRGDSSASGRANQTVVSSFQYEVRVPTDPGSGLPSGRRQHSPVTFTKVLGASSPQLFQALIQNESLTSVTFDFVAAAGDGTQQVVQRVRLNNATVSDIRQHAGAARGTWLEDISLIFQSITITNLPTGTTATDSPSAV